MIDRSHLIGRVDRQGLLAGTRATVALMTPRERLRALGLIASMNVNAILNLVGLSSMVPFVHLVLDASPLEGNALMARWLRWVGFADPNTALLAVGGSVVALVLIKNLYTLIHTGWINRLGADAELRMSSDLLRRVAEAPYDWLATQNAMVLRELALGRTSEWARSTIRTLLQLASDCIFLLFTVILIVAVSPATGLAATLGALCIAVALIWICRRFIVRHAEQKRVNARLGLVAATEAILGGRDVRMSRAGDLLVKAYARAQRQFGLADMRNRQWQLVPNLGLEVIAILALIGISLSAMWSGAARSDIAALLALYAVVAIRAIPVVGKIVTSIALVASSIPAVAELRDFIGRLPPPAERDTQQSDRFDGWQRLVLERVGYTYPGKTQAALGPIDLVLERGKSIGIVGASGAGKSTLIDLLVGLLRPTSGTISVDDAKLEGAAQIAWRARIGYVTQTPFMLDGTMAENIEFGMPHTPDSDERCHAAAITAGLETLLAGLPAGLATQLGDRGVMLSGGQRQRVAIARALYRNADLLVLDEATSALDSVTEREITDSIAGLHGKLTIVIVAHRLSTALHADEIVVLDEGRIAARGPHAELMSVSKIYRRLVEAQTLDVDRQIG